MSSSYVRSVVRTILGNNPHAVYHDTVNRVPDDPVERFWCSAEFSVTARERATFCSQIEEVGFVQVLVFGPPGRGDQEIMQKADAIDQLFQDYVDPQGHLEFSPGNVGDADSVTGHYGYMLYILYHLR